MTTVQEVEMGQREWGFEARSAKPWPLPTTLETALEVANYADPEKKSVDLSVCDNSGASEMVRKEILREVGRNPKLLYLHWDSQDSILRRQLGELHDVPLDSIIITSGAMAGIDYSFKVFVSSGVKVGLLTPDFPGFPHYAEGEQAQVEWLDRLQFPFQFSADEIAGFARDKKAAFIILSNPSGVTGTMKDRNEIEHIVRSNPKTFFVIDEADTIYPDRSSASLVNTYGNVAFIGSFSKFYGLSGLRMGYMAVPSSVAGHFRNILNPLEVTSIGLLAARVVLEDKKYQAETQTRVENNLKLLEYACAGTTYRVVPGSSCLASYVCSQDADTYVELGKRGINLAQGKVFGIDSGGRANLGETYKINKLCEAIKEIHGKT